jgi:hypothetical protein
MDAKEINQTFDLVSYVSGLVSIRKNGAYFIGPCPICGGRDRFNLKRTNSGDVWMCRKCKADKYHSALDFLMAYHNESFKDALKRAGGNTQPPRREIGNGKPMQSPAPVQVVPDSSWQAEAWKVIDAANSRLIGADGRPGREYLGLRGIHRGSIFMHLLGYDPAKYDQIGKVKRPAIVIPWLDLGDTVTAVKYRFIDELGRSDIKRRFTAKGGSLPNLFGLQHILDSDKTLLFVEGELNAISVLQTLPRGVSVVSSGGDTNGNAALLRTLAGHYRRVVIWADEPSKAREIRDRMNRPEARILKSPVIDGVKYDANQMLQAGLLMEFIQLELSAECLGIPVPAVLQETVTA